MADPNVSRDLLAAIAAHVAVVRTANGYRTDVGARVDLERMTTPPSASTPPRISLGVETLRLDPFASGLRKRDYRVTAEVILAADMSNAEALALDAIEDLVDRVPETVRLTLTSGHAADITFESGQVLVRPQGMPATAAQVILTASVQERM